MPENSVELKKDVLQGLPEDSWAALSIGDRTVIGTGATQEEATESARQDGHTEMSLVRVTHKDEDEQVFGPGFVVKFIQPFFISEAQQYRAGNLLRRNDEFGNRVIPVWFCSQRCLIPSRG